MADSLGTLDFFLLEAGEYLERLDAVAQTAPGPFAPADEFVRLARAFRGSAIMANQHGMARAAQGLESVARALREARLNWDEGSRGDVIRAVDDCKILMRRLRTPDPGDTEKAEQIGIKLDRMSGRASAAMRAQQGPGLDAGGRAFVAREAATIGSVLQHTARALAGDPGSRDVLNGVAPAMSALRGVAVLNDLPPLGDILAAIEATVKEIAASPGGAGREGTEVFEAAARALARAAKEVVDTGRPDADSDEARAFAARALSAVAASAVPVESLFFDDAGPHVIQRGAPPARASFGRVEMVSQGEFLTAASSELVRAASSVQRDLRLFGIAASLKPMTTAGGAALPEALSRFAEAARSVIGRGIASQALEGFVNRLRETADALSAAHSGDETRLAQHVADAAAGLAQLQPAASPAPAPTPRVSVPAPPRGAPAPAPAALSEADLATSYLTLEQLITERGIPLGTIDELVAGATPLPGAPRMSRAPAPVPAPRPPAPAAAAPAADDAGVVPVESLLYGGPGALQRILELKPALAAAARRPGDASLEALLHEVFDLVELGLGKR